MIRVAMPIMTVSLLNMREHWRATAKRKAEHRYVVSQYFKGLPVPALPITVTLTRWSCGTLDAHDNLPSAFKHIVDGLAAWIGIDDASNQVEWKYAQRKCPRGKFGVTVEIESLQKSETRNQKQLTAGL